MPGRFEVRWASTPHPLSGVPQTLKPARFINTFFLPNNIPATAVELGVLMFTGHLMLSETNRGVVHVFEGALDRTDDMEGAEVCTPKFIAKILNKDQTNEEDDPVFTCWVIPSFTFDPIEERPPFWLRTLLRKGLADLWEALGWHVHRTNCYYGNAVAACVWSQFTRLPLARSVEPITDIEDELDFVDFLLASEWTNSELCGLFEFTRDVMTFFQDPLTMHRRESNAVDVSWGGNEMILQHVARFFSDNDDGDDVDNVDEVDNEDDNEDDVDNSSLSLEEPPEKRRKET